MCRLLISLRTAVLILLLSQGLISAIGQEKYPPQILALDLWSGKTARDSDFVFAMVNARINNAPKEGERAPQIVLTDAKSGETRALSELRSKKPVVLFFGSRSCNITQGSSEAVKQLWKRFGDVADFYMIYIREAPPEGGFGSLDSGPERGAEAAKQFTAVDSETAEQRAAAAVAFGKEKEIEFPILIDRMDDATTVRWGAWPVRLFFIDTLGKVVFSGQQGPWFHKPTRSYFSALDGEPMHLKNLPGYSQGSLEDFLEKAFPKE